MKKLFICILILFSFSAFADVTILESTSEGDITSYYSSGRMAYFVNGSVTNITDANKGTIYVFNPFKKTYFQKTFAEMEALAEEMNKQTNILTDNQQYKNLMKTLPKAKTKIKKIGTANIAGYNCDEYEISISMSPMGVRICTSKDVEKLVNREIKTKKIDKLMSSVSMEGSDSKMAKAIQELKDKGGYPMMEKTTSSIPGMPTDETIVKSVSKTKIKSSVFEVPDGYRRVSMQEAMGGEF